MTTDCSNCKCRIRPWKECFDCCAGKLLRFANPHQMVEYLHLDHALANKVFQITADDRIERLRDIEKHLDNDEVLLLNNELKVMDETAWNWATKLFESKEGTRQAVTV